MRIVSLVPAGTDIVCELGLEESLVGVTHECDAVTAVPPERLTRSLVATESMTSGEIDAAVSARAASGAPMYEVDVERLLGLAPDLVISQNLCDVCALPAHAIERVLADTAPDVTLISLDGRSIESMLQSITAIAERTGRANRGHDTVGGLRARLDRVASAVAGRDRSPVVCLEWLDPPYVSGHWIPEMIERAGGIDLLGRPGGRSIAVSWSAIEQAHAPTVIAMPCGYDLEHATAEVDEASKRDAWRRAIGDARVFAAAGGAYFTRPGPKLVTGIEVLVAVFHPEAVSWDIPDGVMACK
ncbi:MAG TPA: ABC transporter substrate-binding protein [Gemmatimonadaceae bacterium]|jgi:iron complex transport system substrate-binding protein|nr:ABC transporter substrate-binding protein [Gemmatimonadaceae bacterium]